LEANKPTGISKDEHIAEILRMPQVISRFESLQHRRPNLQQDVKSIFRIYERLQIETLANPDFIEPLPGVIETLKQLKTRSVPIVATTGFSFRMVQVLVSHSQEDISQYFASIIPADDYRITRGRPFPDEVWAAMQTVGCDDVAECIKVDDTNPGILAGKRAGVKTMGVIRYSNFTGLETDDIDKLEKSDPEKCRQLLHSAHKHIQQSQPTYVCQSFKEILSIVA
jgi:phosphonoacetaldehyde hydrolase